MCSQSTWERIIAFLLCMCFYMPGFAFASGAFLPIERTEIQSQKSNYVPIEEVGSYRSDVITKELIDHCALPPATAAELPYWTGYILENKIYTQEGNEAWRSYAQGGPRVFLESELKHIQELGFNCIRVLYSLSFLSNPQDIMSIDLAELEQLDELISWGLKYNLHVMVSITGMPGKKNTSREEESVNSNAAVMADPVYYDAYSAYMEMLARRYAEIPANVLSFELLAEPKSDDTQKDPIKAYVKALTPVAKSMWKHNPDRILIANDMWHQVPTGLAKIGCCLSLHNHIYFVNSDEIQNMTNVKCKTHWPMEYMPSLWQKGQTITLTSENGFEEGTLQLHYEFFQKKPEVRIDGEIAVTQEENRQNVQEYEAFQYEIPAGTKTIEMRFKGTVVLLVLELNQASGNVILPTHDAFNTSVNDKKVTILVHSDGSTENIDKPQKVVDGPYLYKTYIEDFVKCAKKYKVSFLMTEVGTDTQSLTPDEYVAYHECWLKELSQRGIPWMYNCIHNIYAPKSIMWQNERGGFTQIRTFEDSPYAENAMITDLLVKYQQIVTP